MRGLNIHTQPRQHLAEGGLVGSIKRIFTSDPEREARIAKYKADKAAESAAPAASAPAPAPAPAPAVSDYNSGGALKRREKALGLANGGIVRGPGTGTSDDIPDEMREGSYVLPADTTQTVGAQTPAMLDQLRGNGGPRGLPTGKPIPVQLSNGETKLTPEDVHAIGVQALDSLKGATHTPVGRGMPGIPGGPQDQTRMFFAEGGAVTEEERLRRQTEAYVAGAQAAAATRPPVVPAPAPAPLAGRVAQIPVGGQVAPPVPAPAVTPSVLDTDPQARADREAVTGAAGTIGRAAADIASLPMRGVAGALDSTVVRGLRAAGANVPYISPTLVPQGVDPSSITPFTDQARMQQPAPAAAPAAAAPAPAGLPQTTTRPPVGAPAPLSVRSAVPASTALDGLSPSQIPTVDLDQAAAGNPVAPGVYRNGNSFGDSQAAADAGAAPRGLPSAQNNAAAEALAARSQADSVARVTAPAARGIPGVQAATAQTTSNNWQLRKDMENAATSAASITANGGRFDPTKGNNAAQAALKNAQAVDLAARGAQPTLDRAAMDANAGLQREGMQQQGGIDREVVQQTGANTRAARGLAIDRERLGVDRTRAASENASRDVATAGAQQMQQLRNVLLDPNTTPAQRKQAETSIRAISGRAEAANRYTVVPGGQEVSPQGVAFTRPSQVLDNQTGQFVNQGGTTTQQPIGENPQALAIKNNANLTREQKTAELRKLGY